MPIGINCVLECDDTPNEVEFTRLARDVLKTLHLVVAFIG